LKNNLGSILLIVLILTSSVFVGTAFASQAEKTAVIVGFKGLPDAAIIHAHGGQITYQYNIINAIACSLPSQAIDALQKNPNVAYVEEDFAVEALEYGYPTEDWGITQIDAKTVHTTNKGYGVKVAVIDTGINKDHLDLNVNYKDGYDFVNHDSDPMDDNGHGTHCAGIIAADLDGPTDLTRAVVGVAPEAWLYAYKVLNRRGTGTTSAIIAGINQAVIEGVQVISLSLGSISYSQGLYDACLAAVQNNIVVVAASGNSGNTATGSTVNYPAKFDFVIAVGATDVYDNLATFSSTGPEVDVVAPGVRVLSDYKDINPYDGLPNSDTVYMDGTSMACPHVAGTVALMLSMNSAVTPAQVQSILQSTALDRGAVGFDNYYGYGRVDAAAAVAQCGTPDTVPPGQVADLTATADSAAQITLSWTANTEPDLKGYNVYRAVFESEAVKVGFVAKTTNSYVDSGLSAATTYYYQVTAVDQVGNEGFPSEVASATTLQLQLMKSTIDMALKTSKIFTYATATVKITDVAGDPISGATVSGKWSGATTDSDVGVTDATGQVTLQSNNVRNAKTGTTFTFTITAITKEGYTLDETSEKSDYITK
jgi:subtilisin family serine protease